MRPALPPGPSWSPTIGTLRWAYRPVSLMEGCRERYGDVFTVRFLHEGTTVFLSSPDDLRLLFTAGPDTVQAGAGRRLLRPVLGDHSLVLLDGEEHMEQRRLMLPPFHGDRMQAYRELVAEVTRAELSTIPRGVAVPMGPRMRAIALEVIMRAIFGVHGEERLALLRRRLLALLDWIGDPRKVLPLALLGPARARRLGLLSGVMDPVDELVAEEIAARRAADDVEEREDVMSMLVLARHSDGRPMSDAEIRDQLMTLLVAGHETTATGLSWAVERILRHPDALERLLGEIAAGEERYLDAVVTETLRLRPVLPVVSRLVVAPLELTRHVLPPGVIAAACPFLLHRRPDLYPDPRRFLPERFLDERPRPYTWTPFGGGVRRCIGGAFAMLEMKTVLRTLLEEAELRPERREAERIGRRAISLAPARGAATVVRDRTSSSVSERCEIAAR